MFIELALAGLSAGYRTPVIRGIDASFRAGSITAVLGANGAGKTTLLRTLAGCAQCLGGSFSYGDQPLNALPQRERARYLAYVPQVAAAPPALSVNETVALARYPHRGRADLLGQSGDAATAQALAAFELMEFADRRCDALSGGEWRKVLLAQGLAQGTPVLLLDEPTAFLDPPARHQLLETLREAAHVRGLAVVVVLHEPLLARRYADDALLLKDGEIAGSGSAQAILTDATLAALYRGSADWLQWEGQA